MENLTTDTVNKGFSITRLLPAPVELVWQAWTSPEHIANWWGPEGFTNSIHTMEVKKGEFVKINKTNR